MQQDSESIADRYQISSTSFEKRTAEKREDKAYRPDLRPKLARRYLSRSTGLLNPARRQRPPSGHRGCNQSLLLLQICCRRRASGAPAAIRWLHLVFIVPRGT